MRISDWSSDVCSSDLLIAREPVATGSGFGADIRDAMEARARELEAAGLARRQGSGFRFERNLIETLRAREIDAATDAIARRTGPTHRPSTEGDYVRGVYRARVPQTGRASARERGWQ